jgi:hypothetical protein
MLFIEDSEKDFKNKYSKFLENNDLRKVNDEFVEQIKHDQMKSKNRKKTKAEIRAEYKRQVAFLLWSSIMVYFTYHFFVGWRYLGIGIADIAKGRCNPSLGNTCGTFDIVCRFNGLGLGWFTKFSVTHPVCELFRNTIGNLISSLMRGDISLFARTASPVLFPITLKKAIEKAVDFLFDCLDDPELAAKVNKESGEMMQKYDNAYKFDSEKAFGYEKWKAERAAAAAAAASAASASAVLAASAAKSEVQMSAVEKRSLARAEALKKKADARILREEQKAHQVLIKEQEKVLKAQARADAAASKASAKASQTVSIWKGRMGSNKTAKNVVAANRKVRVLSYGSMKSPEITKEEFENNLAKLGVLDEFKTVVKKVDNKTCKVMHGGFFDFGLFSVPATMATIGTGINAVVAIKGAIHALFAGGTTYYNWDLFQTAYRNYGMNASSYLGSPEYAHTNFVLNLLGLGVKCQQGQSIFSHAAQTVFTGMSLYGLFALSSEIGNHAVDSYENFSDYSSKFYANMF